MHIEGGRLTILQQMERRLRRDELSRQGAIELGSLLTHKLCCIALVMCHILNFVNCFSVYDKPHILTSIIDH
jgi:hypothetical protein